MSDTSPTLRRRQLASELQRIREEAELTLEDLAGQVGWSRAKLSRLFTAQSGIRPRDLELLMDALGITDDEQREQYAKLAREARVKGWWHRYADLLANPYSVLIGLERDASSIRMFESSLVPGLLQTPDYAHEVIRSMLMTARPSEIKKNVDVRMARQAILTRDDPAPVNVWAVLDEAVIRRVVGNRGLMRLQLEHLIETASLPNVTLQVLPFDAGAHASMDGPFVLLSFPNPTHPDVVYLEGRESDLYLEKETEIEDYTLAFDHLRAVALGPDKSLEFIDRAAKDLR